jgi:glucose/arabinose dehydrogenase
MSRRAAARSTSPTPPARRRGWSRGAGAVAAVAALTLAWPAAAVAGHLDDARPGEPIDDPIPGHVENGAIQLELETLAEGDGLTAPNWGTFAPGVPGRLFVVDQDGPMWAVNTTTGAKRSVLDTASLLVPLILDADERGFLGAAFHPGFATNGLLYTMTSEPLPGVGPTPPSQPDHLATLREWRVNPATFLTGTPPSPASSRVVLQVLEPQFNHNGGAIFFGTRPDDRDLLYITSGDGGCADDQQGQLGLAGEGPCISHEGPGNAQRLDNLLGKILRIDPRAGGGAAYIVPAGNPFVGVAGARPEIFAYGLRNPFRASSDRVDLGGTGQVWTADVGQNAIEEVDVIRPGGNFGWRVKEGRWLFDPAGIELFGFASDGFVHAFSPGSPAGLVDPVVEYDHDEGVAVIGGFVYRGSRLPALRGRYVFGDYSDGFKSGNGRVMVADPADRADVHRRTPGVFNLVNGHLNVFVLGMGEDAKGELYVLANKTGGPSDETGVVMRLVARCTGDADCRD